MSQALKNVLVFGASGNVGGPILNALLASQAFNVSVLTSSETKTFPSGVHIHQSTATSTDEHLLSVLRGQDAVVSAVGPTGFDEQKRLIGLAAKAGVKRFLPSEFSVNTNSETLRQLVPLFQVKWDHSLYLKEMEKFGMTWTGVLTGFAFDFVMKAGIVGFNLQEHVATIWDDGNTRTSFTNFSTLCQAVVHILQHPEDTANRYIHIASFTTTQNEILAELKAAAPEVEWKVTSTTTKEQVANAQSLLGQGNMMGMLALVQAGTLGNLPGLKADFETDEGLWNEKLNLPKETLSATIEKLVRS